MESKILLEALYQEMNQCSDLHDSCRDCAQIQLCREIWDKIDHAGRLGRPSCHDSQYYLLLWKSLHDKTDSGSSQD